jgi:hypothetical protein
MKSPSKIAVVLAIHLALTGSGIPCLLLCAADAAEAHEHCHESTAGDRHDSCPDDSPCVGDPTLALAAHVETPVSPQDAGLAVVVAEAAGLARPPMPVALHLRALPDRSPPIPPGFSVLRN